MQTKSIVPLYARLPHGPHRLERHEVLSHQRARIQGAIVEAVAHSGYEAASVKQVTALAGVSRRAFYEQFANKEDCFLATFDLIATGGLQRARRAYLEVDGCLETRLRSAFGELAGAVTAEPKAAALVASAPTAGRAGARRQRTAIAAGERLLARALAQSGAIGPLPLPIVRGIAGGVDAALRVSLSAPEPAAARLTEALLRWTLPLDGPISAECASRMAATATARVRACARGASARSGQRSRRSGKDERARLLRAALHVAAHGDYLALSAPQLADEAHVPVEAFFEMFRDIDECYAEALDTVAVSLLELVRDSELHGADWPRTVRRTLARLLAHLSEQPLHAHTIGAGAFTAGGWAVRRNLELARAVASSLVAGAPVTSRGELELAGVAGAIWHAVACQAADGRVQLLPALTDYLAYVVLAPFIGAQAAARIVTEDSPASGLCG